MVSNHYLNYYQVKFICSVFTSCDSLVMIGFQISTKNSPIIAPVTSYIAVTCFQISTQTALSSEGAVKKNNHNSFVESRR